MLTRRRAFGGIKIQHLYSKHVFRVYSTADKRNTESRSSNAQLQLDLDARRSLLLEQLRTRQRQISAKNQPVNNLENKSESKSFPWEMQVAWLPVIRGYLRRVLDDHRLNRLPDAIATNAVTEQSKDSLEDFIIKNTNTLNTGSEEYDWSLGFKPPAEPPAFHLRRYQKWTPLTTGRDHVDLIYASRLMLFLTPYYVRNSMKAPAGFSSVEIDEAGDLPFKRHQSTDCLLQDLVHSFLFTNQRLLDIKGIQFFQNLYLNQLRLPVQPWLFHPMLSVYARQGNLKEMWTMYMSMKKSCQPNAHTFSIMTQAALSDTEVANKNIVAQIQDRITIDRKQMGIPESRKELDQKSWIYARNGRVRETLKVILAKDPVVTSIADLNTVMVAYASRANVHRSVEATNFLGLFHTTTQALLEKDQPKTQPAQRQHQRRSIDIALEKAMFILENSVYEPNAKTYHTLLGLALYSNNHAVMSRLMQLVVQHLSTKPGVDSDKKPETRLSTIWSNDVADGLMWNYCVTYWMAQTTATKFSDNYRDSVNQKPIAQAAINSQYGRMENLSHSSTKEREELWRQFLTAVTPPAGQEPWIAQQPSPAPVDHLIVPLVDMETIFSAFSKHIQPNATTLSLLLYFCDVNKLPSLHLWLKQVEQRPQWRADRALREQLKRMGRWHHMTRRWNKQ